MMTSEPMSDERLAAIKARAEEIPGSSFVKTQRELSQTFFDRNALVAEVERLRVREAALVAFAQAVASDHEHKFRYEDRCKHCGIDRSEWSADIQRQARALLAASEPTDATTAE